MNTKYLVTVKSLLIALIMGFMSVSVMAATEFTLEGKAVDAKYDDRSNIKLSLLRWPEQTFQQDVVVKFTGIQNEFDAEKFAEFLNEQDTIGYVFTGAATGYAIKYAWQEEQQEEHMTFLITPGFKTRNSSIWENPNQEQLHFSLLEVVRDGEKYILKSSLKTTIRVEDLGLVLEDFDSQDITARLEKVRPYYLEDS